MSEDKQTFGLEKNINKAAAIRNMCQTPGFQVLREAFEEKVHKATKKILDPAITDEEISSLRRQVSVWVEIEKLLKDLMTKGELSKRALENIQALNQLNLHTDYKMSYYAICSFERLLYIQTKSQQSCFAYIYRK